MAAYNPGDKVLLSLRYGHALGTVQNPACNSDSYAVRTLGGRRFSEVGGDEMRQLPPDALMLQWGSRICARDDAPRYAGCAGSAVHAEFIDGVLGYWVQFDSGVRTWIPAAALTAEAEMSGDQAVTDKTTAADDRALCDRVRTLRKVKLTFNEDQIWALYRLVAAERTTGTPKLLPDLSPELDHAMGMALAQLSDAHMDLTAPKEGDI